MELSALSRSEKSCIAIGFLGGLIFAVVGWFKKSRLFSLSWWGFGDGELLALFTISHTHCNRGVNERKG